MKAKGLYKGLYLAIALAVLFSLALAIVPTQTARAETTVLVDNLQPSWTAPGGGGVYSLYNGPPVTGLAPNYYTWVSPGNTAVYLGREAGIIKAGLVGAVPDEAPAWDDGVFAFKPNSTINVLAAGALTYDVVNQYGENPVWMTIRIDTGTPTYTTYQFVPTTNPTGWHTVNAAAGQWQKWNNDDGDTSGNPLISLSDVVTAHTGLPVSRVYLRLGMGASYHGTAGLGTVAWVDKATLSGVTYDFVVPTYWYVATTGSDTNEGTLASPFLTIQKAIDSAGAGATIHVAAGTYGITSHIAINKSVSIVGDPANKPVVQALNSFDTSYGGTSNYFFRADPAVTATINISNFVLDGNGQNVYGGMRFYPSHSGTIDNCVFQHLKSQGYMGFGIVDYGTLTIQNNVLTDIGRVGIWVGGPNNVVHNNTYTGKGVGDCLDYGIEVGYGGTATITNNTITSCRGVASDLSTSAGILVTTYYGAGTQATITGNTLTGNTEGIAVGYDGADTSVVTAHSNNIAGNIDYGINTTSTTVIVNATDNWWGDPTGPQDLSNDTATGGWYNPLGLGNAVSDRVKYDPYQTQESGVTGGEGCFIATAAYGSYLDSHVDTLRGFRDQYLETNPLGSAFVSLYYKVSPPMAAFIDEHPALKPIVRAGLMPAVAMSSVALNTTPAEKAVILIAMALFAAALIMWLMRRARRLERR